MGISRQFTSEKNFLFYFNAYKHTLEAEAKAYAGTLYTNDYGRFGKMLRAGSGGAGESIIFFAPLYLAETKSLSAIILFSKQTSYGLAQIKLADTATAPTTFTAYGSTIDQYGASLTHNNIQTVTLGSVPAGYYAVLIDCNDKNASSTGYVFNIGELIIFETP